MLTERREVISVVLLLLSLSSSLPSIVTNVSNYTVLTSLEVIHHALHGLTSREVMYILRSHINMMTKATFLSLEVEVVEVIEVTNDVNGDVEVEGGVVLRIFHIYFSRFKLSLRYHLLPSICSHLLFACSLIMPTVLASEMITWKRESPFWSSLIDFFMSRQKNTSLSSSQLHCSSPKTWLGIEVFDSFYQKEKHSLSNLNLQICS